MVPSLVQSLRVKVLPMPFALQGEKRAANRSSFPTVAWPSKVADVVGPWTTTDLAQDVFAEALSAEVTGGCVASPAQASCCGSTGQLHAVASFQDSADRGTLLSALKPNHQTQQVAHAETCCDSEG